mmetsp:Transcript_18581/g.20732  ORF Transcript_18581/g.20732 Transcript_18581/m.20732 type:complete len:283 (+) Transcript_18581:40-888(+)
MMGMRAAPRTVHRWLARASVRAFSTSRLQGRVALVSGAAGGLGKGIAQKFAEEGAHIVVADFNLEGAQSVADALPSALAVQVDVTDEDGVERAFREGINAFGKIDIVVANAGHQHIASVVDMPYTEWRRMIAVHLDGSFLMTRAALRHMYERDTQNGKIILMGSIHSKEASVLKCPYVAAKHGVLGFARAVAKEAGPRGVSVNVVCPGFVYTPLVERQIPEQAKRLDMCPKKVVSDVMLGGTVDGEFSTIEDVAETTLFLAAHPTNALTGQSINVSHGWVMS